MIRIREIQLTIDHCEGELKAAVLRRLGVAEDELKNWWIFKRAIDARKKHRTIFFKYTIDAEVADEAAVLTHLKNDRYAGQAPDTQYRFALHLKNNEAARADTRPVIIGTGPCGLFAGLSLAQAGLRPLLLERGKDARERARDVTHFWRTGQLDARSNVQFGEGGAGAFSDGKLNTQIKDRGNRMHKVLEELVKAGAPKEILYVSKPHIGTDKLIRVVRNLRAAIEALGGEVRFEAHVTDLQIKEGRVREATLESGERIATDNLIVAIGHSARDTFEMLHRRGVFFEPKPFSIGARIEHPQALIDKVQYGRFAGHPKLGASEYKLAHHCRNGRTAYTFCMCPAGVVIAASSEEECLVTNGMSSYARDEANANSGLMVEVGPADFDSPHPLAGVAFQRHWEELAYRLGEGGYKAPVQLVGDFLVGQATTALGRVEPSYRPGVTPCDLAFCLPDYVLESMREAIGAFDQKLRGFALPDAVLTGVETRSSSPVRIRRGETFESVSTQGLYPAGEGAGYAGGIISSAVDGLKVAEAVATHYGEVRMGSVPS